MFGATAAPPSSSLTLSLPRSKLSSADQRFREAPPQPNRGPGAGDPPQMPGPVRAADRTPPTKPGRSRRQAPLFPRQSVSQPSCRDQCPPLHGVARPSLAEWPVSLGIATVSPSDASRHAVTGADARFARRGSEGKGCGNGFPETRAWCCWARKLAGVRPGLRCPGPEGFLRRGGTPPGGRWRSC